MSEDVVRYALVAQISAKRDNITACVVQPIFSEQRITEDQQESESASRPAAGSVAIMLLLIKVRERLPASRRSASLLRREAHPESNHQKVGLA